MNLLRNETLRRWTRQPFFYFLAALALALPLAACTAIPSLDVAGRYAPMADALAAGEWRYAFHPRVSPLLPVLGGVFSFLSGWSGFAGVKLAASLLFALAVFPLFALFKRVFSEQVACWGVLFFLFCSHVLRYAGEGLRDAGKTLPLAIAAWALIGLRSAPRQWRYYLWLGAAFALGTAIRPELMAVIGLILVAAFLCDCAGNRLPYRSVTAGGFGLLLLAPMFWSNYTATGYPVPDIRFIPLIRKFAANNPPAVSVPVRPKVVLPPPSELLPPPVKLPDAVLRARQTGNRWYEAAGYLEGLFEGSYPYFLIPVLLGIGWRIRRREWNAGESVILAILIGHALLLTLQNVIADGYLGFSKRYLIPAAPLAFGWCGWSAIMLWGVLKRRFPACCNFRTACAVTALLMTALYADAFGPVIREYTSRKQSAKRLAIEKATAVIRADYRGERRTEREFTPYSYRSNRRPLVLAFDDIKPAVYLSGGSDTADPSRADYIITGRGGSAPGGSWTPLARIPGRKDEAVVWRRNQERGF
ncbi:glycosyltransferase family 39 protein [Victivallis lenta]|uniref:glycosyltransferase family 39 protein n=1 Tax=Victivallis lenta TaxID=2606640 RepID=UPI0023537C6F|nr:glycosyltransferase family 39 protein [Victivallis lenta]